MTIDEALAQAEYVLSFGRGNVSNETRTSVANLANAYIRMAEVMILRETGQEPISFRKPRYEV